MNTFHRRMAIRISIISVLLALVASSFSWFIARKNAEESIVSLAVEETDQLLHRYDAINLTTTLAADKAKLVAKNILMGLFDVVEIYNAEGRQLVETTTNKGEQIEGLISDHGAPSYQTIDYESLELPDNILVLRVFVPIRQIKNDQNSPVTGYFEGVRVVPAWQRQQIFDTALIVSVMVCLASLFCGAILYPVVVRLSDDNLAQAKEILDSHISIMQALGRAIAKRDSDTGVHNYRVAWMASCIGEKMGLTKSQMRSLISGSFLHDVGKIGVPDSILLKPGKLTEEEWEIMRRHVQLGEDIVEGIGWLDGARDVVAGHHEKWDGSGYHRHLAGENIPLVARIFAVADVFDALCSNRPYKAALGFDAAMAILDEETGTHFDPDVMVVFRSIAFDVYTRLENIGEDEIRGLLAEQIRRHAYAMPELPGWSKILK